MDSQCDPLNSSFKLNGLEREIIGSLSKFEFPKNHWIHIWNLNGLITKFLSRIMSAQFKVV